MTAEASLRRGLAVSGVAVIATVVVVGVVVLLRGDRPEAVDSVTTTVEQPGERTQFLVADGTSITDLGSGSVLLDVPARIVYDDLAGGIVYQTASGAYFGDTTGTDVWHLRDGSREPVSLMPQNGDATLRLMGVFDVDRVATAVVVERQNPGDVDNAAEVMYEVDVRTGDRRRVAVVGGWEKAPVAISWDGTTYVVSSSAEGYSFLDRLSREGRLEPLNEGGLGAECYDEPDCPRVTVATTDGRHLVFTRGDIVDSIELVLWSRQTATEVWTVELTGGRVLGPIAAESDTIVVNHYADGADAPGIGRASIVDIASGDAAEADEDGFVDPATRPFAS